jgi:hypothetical protein
MGSGARARGRPAGPWKVVAFAACAVAGLVVDVDMDKASKVLKLWVHSGT